MAQGRLVAGEQPFGLLQGGTGQVGVGAAKVECEFHIIHLSFQAVGERALSGLCSPGSCVLLCSVSLAGPADLDARALQGTWRPTALEHDGSVATEDRLARCRLVLAE